MAKIVTASRRADGLENVLSLKGVAGHSKVGSNVFTSGRILSHGEIAAIYNSGGVGATIISSVADDMTRKGFYLIDEDNKKASNTDKNLKKLMKKFKKLAGAQKMNTLIRWARAYGGGLLVMRISDGKGLEDPLNEKNIRTIEKMEAHEGGRNGAVTIFRRYSDKNSIKYGEPEIYTITPAQGISYRVHETRTIRLNGREVDHRTKIQLDGWNGSELNPVYENLLSLFSVMSSGEQVLDELVIGTLKLDNLDALVATPEGEEALRRRLDLVDTSKSIETTVAISTTEEYERHTANLGGMDKLQQNSMIILSGSADIPATRLFGQSPNGENATGESDQDNYDAKIQSAQELDYLPALEKLLYLISLSGDVNFEGDFDEVEVVFNERRTPSDYDNARAFEHRARGWTNYIEAGVVSPKEVREEESQLTVTGEPPIPKPEQTASSPETNAVGEIDETENTVQ